MLQEHILDHALISLRDVEKLTVNQGTSLVAPQQMSTTYVLIVHLSGEGKLILDEAQYDMLGHCIYWCEPESTFGIHSNGATEMECLLFRFALFAESEDEPNKLIPTHHRSLFETLGSMPIYPDQSMNMMAQDIWRTWNWDKEAKRFRSLIDFQNMLYQLFIMQYEHSPAESWYGLQRSKDYMMHHYNEKITISVLAQIAGISDKYYVDLFKKRYQLSAMDYLTNLRINQAKQLMLQSKLKLKDIANQVGFQDEFYFSRKFKKEVGVSPANYMKRRSVKIAAYSTYITGQLIALGIMPYAAPIHPKWAGHYFRYYRHEIPVHLDAFKQQEDPEINISLIENAKPDILICPDDIEIQERVRLEKVVDRVIYVPRRKGNWRDQLLITAGYLDLQSAAYAWIEQYDHKLTCARHELIDARKHTITVLRIVNEDIYFHSNRNIAEVLYGELRMKPAFQHHESDYSVKTTLEHITEVNPDILFLMICQETRSLEYWKTLQRDNQWQNLDAVRNHRVVPIPSDPWKEYSPVGLERTLTGATQLLLGFK